MTVTNPQTLDVFAQIAQLTYAENTTPSSMGDYVEITQVIDGPLGFQARAFFNSTRNEEDGHKVLLADNTTSELGSNDFIF